ncbi:hypothetical protein INT44_003509 [Umbelopsis vinacea]|uniref:Uncharacterized protein n=1 Tax=Umbelopsis vinacea TaxID=44442 RepID=A0A8H7PV74_9FUNG|nr:hypothetical protein INT44_003509 [Umbelopsis vinacea]
MFMPQQKLTPEEKAFLRMRTISNVSNFVSVIVAIRAGKYFSKRELFDKF